MNRKNKIFLITLACLTLIAVTLLTTRYLKSRRVANDGKFYDKGINNDIKPQEPSSEPSQTTPQEVDEGTPGEFLKEEDREEEKNDEIIVEEENEPRETFLEIKKEDCEKKCQDYEDDKEDYKYCQEVCGLEGISTKDSISECEDQEGLEEDYCLRDVAIRKLDYTICNKIEDAGIQKMCHNRITEEQVDNNANGD